jgi:hypothetical protein
MRRVIIGVGLWAVGLAVFGWRRYRQDFGRSRS